MIYLFGNCINNHCSALELIDWLLHEVKVHELPENEPLNITCEHNKGSQLVTLSRSVINPFGKERILIDESGCNVEFAIRRIIPYYQFPHEKEMFKMLIRHVIEPLEEVCAKGIGYIKEYMTTFALELDSRQAVHLADAFEWAVKIEEYNLALKLKKEIIDIWLMQRSFSAAAEEK